ncbi:hypothetical protein Nepgr_023524 [Nepenthes gracilis]|uniref:RNase H type-1 domain-containing protein n=1 Tax=Nepenthes gracilis TaxID=150966 RepID=A0AAD3T2P0_NEPGR|nr:hypothetical protein Nepgr_023524 [Nepenthes gracilis]
MPRIPAGVIVYKLGLDPNRKPVRQKRRNHSVEKLVTIPEKVRKLLDADFIREVQYPDWISNVVLPLESAKQYVGVPEWVLHVDKLSTDTDSSAGVVLRTPDGFEVKYSLKLDFSATNNVAEYEALLAGLRLAKECSAK